MNEPESSKGINSLPPSMSAESQALIGQGLMYLQTGHLSDAEQCFRQAIQLTPLSSVAHNNLGISLLRAGNKQDAVTAFSQAITLQPDNASAINNLAIIQLEMGDLIAASTGFRLAIHYQNDFAEAWNNLGNALTKLDETEQAADCYRKALEIRPGQTDPLINLGTVLMELGEYEQGEQAFRLGIRSCPSNPVPLATALFWLTYRDDDQDFSHLHELYTIRHQFPFEQQVLLGFAMGRVQDQMGHHEQAWTAWAEANQLQLILRPFDENNEDRIFTHIHNTMTRTLIMQVMQERSLLPKSDQRRTPVFIVGMMRSGSTLLEQMLAAHPDMAVAGEVPWLQQAVETLEKAPPDAGNSLLDQIGATYLDKLWEKHPGAPMVIDKQLGNYLHLGLIRILFPNAIILHTRRNALDCCFSCYTLRFSNGHGYTFDQRALGRQYLRYRNLMSHWQSVLPAGSILDVGYENLVHDTENQLKRVLSHMKLEWEPACLQPQRVQRAVRTASVLQVRKPVYHSSIGRWRPYQSWLQPLINTLGDFANEAMR